MSHDEMMVIVRHASARTDVLATEIRDTKNKRPEVVRARWLAWHLMRASGLAWKAVARLFGCDHASVMYGVRAFLREREAKAGNQIARGLVAAGAGL